MLGSVIEGGANGVGEDPRMLLHDDTDTINPMPKMISEILSMKFFIVSSLSMVDYDCCDEAATVLHSDLRCYHSTD